MITIALIVSFIGGAFLGASFWKDQLIDYLYVESLKGTDLKSLIKKLYDENQ